MRNGAEVGESTKGSHHSSPVDSISPESYERGGNPGSKPNRHHLVSTALPTCWLSNLQSHFIHTGLTVVWTSQRFIIDQHQTFFPATPLQKLLLHWSESSIFLSSPVRKLSLRHTVMESPCLLTAFCPEWNPSQILCRRIHRPLAEDALQFALTDWTSSEVVPAAPEAVATTPMALGSNLGLSHLIRRLQSQSQVNISEGFGKNGEK